MAVLFLRLLPSFPWLACLWGFRNKTTKLCLIQRLTLWSCFFSPAPLWFGNTKNSLLPRGAPSQRIGCAGVGLACLGRYDWNVTETIRLGAAEWGRGSHEDIFHNWHYLLREKACLKEHFHFNGWKTWTIVMTSFSSFSDGNSARKWVGP